MGAYMNTQNLQLLEMCILNAVRATTHACTHVYALAQPPQTRGSEVAAFQARPQARGPPPLQSGTAPRYHPPAGRPTLLLGSPVPPPAAQRTRAAPERLLGAPRRRLRLHGRRRMAGNPPRYRRRRWCPSVCCGVRRAHMRACEREH